MSLFLQIITTLFLILGVICGELISTKVFGELKKVWLYFLEIFGFVFLIVLMLNTIAIFEYSKPLIVFLYFISGFLVIVFVRGIVSGIGFFSERTKRIIKKKINELDYIFGLKKALERRGFKKEEIIRILKEVGFSKSKIEKVFENRKTY